MHMQYMATTLELLIIDRRVDSSWCLSHGERVWYIASQCWSFRVWAIVYISIIISQNNRPKCLYWWLWVWKMVKNSKTSERRDLVKAAGNQCAKSHEGRRESRRLGPALPGASVSKTVDVAYYPAFSPCWLHRVWCQNKPNWPVECHFSQGLQSVETWHCCVWQSQAATVVQVLPCQGTCSKLRLCLCARIHVTRT